MKQDGMQTLTRVAIIVLLGVAVGSMAYTMALRINHNPAMPSSGVGAKVESRYESLEPVETGSASDMSRDGPVLTGHRQAAEAPSVHVTVTSEGRTPVKGATVFAEPDHPCSSERESGRTLLGMTDESGALEAKVVGVYGQVLGAKAQGFVVSSALIDGNAATYDLIARPASELVIHLYDPQGSPVQGALVAVSRRALPRSWSSSLLEGEIPGPDPRDAIYRGISDKGGRVSWQLLDGIYDLGVRHNSWFARGHKSRVEVKGATSLDLTMASVYVAWIECDDSDIVAYTAMCDTLSDAITPGEVLQSVAKELRGRRAHSMVVTSTCKGSARICMLSRNGDLFEGSCELAVYADNLTPYQARQVLSLSKRVPMLEATVQIRDSRGVAMPRGTSAMLQSTEAGPLRNFSIALEESTWLPMGSYRVVEMSEHPVVEQIVKQLGPQDLQAGGGILGFQLPYSLTPIAIDIQADDSLYLPFLTIEMSKTSGEVFRLRGTTGVSSGTLVPVGKYIMKVSAPGYLPCERRAEILGGGVGDKRFFFSLRAGQ